MKSGQHMKSRRFLTVCLILGGLVFRLVLGGLGTDKLEWDAMAYSSYASRLLAGDHRANCCTLGPGYPLVVAAIYSHTGIDNIQAVRILQAITDTATGVLLSMAAGSLFGAVAGMITLLLYLFNPLTASYTGVVLTEITTLFLISLAVYLNTRKGYARHPLFWISAGLIFGMLTAVKISLYQYALVAMIALSVVRRHKLRITSHLGLMILGFAIASIYSVITIYRTFGVFSVVPPYKGFYGSLYSRMYMGRSGEMSGEPVTTGNEALQYIQESLYLNNYNPKGIPAQDRIYKSKFIGAVKTGWQAFAANTVKSMFWIWDKYHLYIYHDPFYPYDTWPLRIGNIALLLTCGAGMYIFVRKDRKNIFHPLVVLTALMFLYITFTYALFNNESRLSLPFYPFAFVWAGLGGETIFRYVIKKRQDRI